MVFSDFHMRKILHQITNIAATERLWYNFVADAHWWDWWSQLQLASSVSPLCHGKDPLRWRHNDHAGVSNHQPRGCLLNRLCRRKSKKTSKLRVTGLCAGNSPGTGEFPAQMASYAENVSIWWRHHAKLTSECPAGDHPAYCNGEFDQTPVGKSNIRLKI